MSIVEKALQKAQQTSAAEKAKQDAAPDEAKAAPSVEPPKADGQTPRGGPRPQTSAPAASAVHPSRQTVVVDPARLRQFGLLPAEDLLPEAIDEFRRIKWPLLESALGRAAGGSVAAENNLILITSAMAEEGKSFTALNLAGAIGRERDCRCILVDADLRSPKLSQALGLEDRKGIHDLLADESLALTDIIYTTDIEGLLFVPAGTGGESGPELLASRRMVQVCAELSEYVHDGVRAVRFLAPAAKQRIPGAFATGGPGAAGRTRRRHRAAAGPGSDRAAGPHQADQLGPEQRAAHGHRRRSDELWLWLRLRIP